MYRQIFNIDSPVERNEFFFFLYYNSLLDFFWRHGMACYYFIFTYIIKLQYNLFHIIITITKSKTVCAKSKEIFINMLY